ncbi:peptidase family M41-domain-containing protein [Schizothecium vesticola]|uniref:Peptidase family M41-domain-containing protein n=1 Tax=Schizothecium vesticola TaxID=314040 RepID=A0AA40FBJ4_9PEZI|nr:peptidase family M41-domain-containing protein [Schizothecium vesticola]
MFRPATRQLARSYARYSLRTAARPSYRAAAAFSVPATRTYAIGTPRSPKDDKNGGAPRKKDEDAPASKPSSKEEDSRPPLPEGWVYLTEDEVKAVKSMFADLPSDLQRLKDETPISDMLNYGVPVELRDVIKKKMDGNFSVIFDTWALLKIRGKLVEAFERYEENKKRTDFDSNDVPPGVEQTEAMRKAREAKSRRHGEEGQPGHEQGAGEGQGPRPGKGPKKDPGSGDMKFGDWVTIGLTTGGLFALYSMLSPDSSRDISWQELRKNFLDKGLVERMTVVGDRVRVDLNLEATRAIYPDSVAARPGFHYYFGFGSVELFENNLEEAQRELGIPPSERIPVDYASSSMIGSILLSFGPTLLLVGLIIYASRRSGGMGGGSGGGVFGFGKSRAKMFNQDTAVRVKFDDVAGMDEAKLEIMEFVSFLKTPERFQKLGAKIPRGAILSGPPGTGKTLLAKATAGESQVPFFSVSGSEFVEMFVGVGASRVRDLFATARKNAPCIIFIDEIDAIGRSRSDGGFKGGGNDEREATLNQILTEMDGFNTSEQVVVLAGTNRPDVLDQALMRPGRFDRHINIDRPTMKGRKDIFKVHLKKILTKEDTEYLTGRLAALTPGFAGADIANAVNEAALVAARANAESVAMIHFEQAIERVIGGLERRSLVLSPEEKRTVAYHEAGHAICGWFFRWADPLLKVSIIPRGSGALGYAQYLPSGDAYLMNTNQLMDRMAMTLGGRVSEELHFPTVTSGASDDFKKVTAMATTMVTQWGMSEKLGPLHFKNDDNQLHKPFAESTAQTIDAEVRRIVDQAYAQCKALLTKHKAEVGIVAEELLRKEMLTRDDLVRLLGPREWPDKEEFSKYFDGKHGAPPPFSTENTDSPMDSEPAPSLFDAKDAKDVKE